MLAFGVALAACTATENPLDLGVDNDRLIVIGSLSTPENEIIAQLYGHVLDDAGFEVTYDLTIGGRAAFIRALDSGSLDIVPDYSGALLHGIDPRATASSTAEIAAALPVALAEFDLVALAPSPADASEALVVSKRFASDEAVASIADLAPIASTLIVGARSGFNEQYFGALTSEYGIDDLEFQVIDGDGSASVADLVGDVVQVTSLPKTSPLIAENELVVLADPETVFAAQNVTPIVNADTLTDELERLLNRVSAKLSTEALASLNAQYAGDDKPTAADIARGWLLANGLIR